MSSFCNSRLERENLYYAGVGTGNPGSLATPSP